MVIIKGLTGYRPANSEIAKIFTTPPYDVIKPGTGLDYLLKANSNSLYHIILGENPKQKFDEFIRNGMLISDDEPCFYIYEQQKPDGVTRTGVLTATEVSDYSERKIIDHEDTHDDKVNERIKLARVIGHSSGAVITSTESPIRGILDEIKRKSKQIYYFKSAFNELSDLCGITNSIFRISEDSPEGIELTELIGQKPLYILDGHHRYKASLVNNQKYFLNYICQEDEAKIQAYNRVIKLNNDIKFDEIVQLLDLKKIDGFKTPPKQKIIYIYANGQAYSWSVNNEVTDDIVEKLDVSILQNEFYPLLGVNTDEAIIKNVDCHPESDLGKMVELVNSNSDNSIAVALHPVILEDVKAVANAGKRMPRKSTYFEKILSGIFIMRNE